MPGTEICERKCINLLITDYLFAHPISYNWKIKKSIYKKKNTKYSAFINDVRLKSEGCPVSYLQRHHYYNITCPLLALDTIYG
jgi:hypothetical protein